MIFDILSKTSWYLLFITAFIFFVFRNKLGSRLLIYFSYYLIYISLGEIVAKLITLSPIKYNLWWYNIMLNGQYFFYFYLYYHLIKHAKVKKIFKALYIGYIFYFVLNYLVFFKGWNVYQSFPFTFGNVVIILSVFWFLIELFQTEEILNLNKSLIFWISLGVLFHFILYAPTEVVATYYFNLNINEQFIIKIISLILYFSNISMYFFFLFGLWKTKLSKSS